jgi:cytoplasmic iron level regulating protein YaaA (DUF328/UPF0246 family)
MLIILPPSETKRQAPVSGDPVDLATLSFPDLTALREDMVDALVRTSRRPDAMSILRVGPSLGAEVARNTAIRELPTMAASDLYSGPLHAALDFASLPADAKRRAGTELVITSSLWGMVRPDDRIPPYRLLVWAQLEGIGRVDHAWRKVVPNVLAIAAGDGGVVVDLRSPPYQAIGRPAGLSNRTAMVRVLPEPGALTIGDVVAKRIRGRVARHLVESGVVAEGPGDLAHVLSGAFPVRLEPPETAKGSWTVLIRARD